jgi:hypothetical protein
VLENQTVTTTEAFVSCTTIEAGADFRIESPGDVTFNAPGTIALKSGFSVGSGAHFVAGSGGVPELSHRTYAYRAPRYFLTSASLVRDAGSWGTLEWSYDRIGNRLSETRDGGSPDVYQYLVNAGTGNTPILDQAFAYDGRSFLRSAQETAGGTSSVDPLYDSAGLVHALRRRPSVIEPEELVVFPIRGIIRN